jgi:hypothetical protein
LFSDEKASFLEFMGGTWLSIVVSIFVMAMYVPVIVGTLSRHKLLSETTELKIAGGLGAVAGIIGGLLGALGVGMAALTAGL